jgi:hypothetical protein
MSIARPSADLVTGWTPSVKGGSASLILPRKTYTQPQGRVERDNKYVTYLPGDIALPTGHSLVTSPIGLVHKIDVGAAHIQLQASFPLTGMMTYIAIAKTDRTNWTSAYEGGLFFGVSGTKGWGLGFKQHLTSTYRGAGVFPYGTELEAGDSPVGYSTIVMSFYDDAGGNRLWNLCVRDNSTGKIISVQRTGNYYLQNVTAAYLTSSSYNTMYVALLAAKREYTPPHLLPGLAANPWQIFKQQPSRTPFSQPDAPLYSLVDEPVADDADYISATEPATCDLALSAVTDPGTSSGQVLTIRAKSDNGNTLVATLKQDTTTIATRTITGLTSSYEDYPITLTSGECDAITDYSSLHVQLEADE